MALTKAGETSWKVEPADLRQVASRLDALSVSRLSSHRGHGRAREFAFVSKFIHRSLPLAAAARCRDFGGYSTRTFGERSSFPRIVGPVGDKARIAHLSRDGASGRGVRPMAEFRCGGDPCRTSYAGVRPSSDLCLHRPGADLHRAGGRHRAARRRSGWRRRRLLSIQLPPLHWLCRSGRARGHRQRGSAGKSTADPVSRGGRRG